MSGQDISSYLQQSERKPFPGSRKLSQQKMNINIQSGASLAMRGHQPHDKGGIILEGKFMDISQKKGQAKELKNRINSDLKEIQSNFRSVESDS